MFNESKKLILWFYGIVCAFILSSIPAFAVNPSMGDNSGTIKLIMIILLIVSAVLLILLGVLSAMKKRKK